MKRLTTVMKELGHERIDLLKLDIEGAEYGVIEDMQSSGILPKQLLVEFHHRFEEVGTKKTEEALARLKSMGYSLVHVTDTGEEYTLVLR